MLADADMLEYCNNMTSPSSSLATFSHSVQTGQTTLGLFNRREAGLCTTTLLTVSQWESTRACDVETLWVHCTVGQAWKASQQTGRRSAVSPLLLFTFYLSFWEDNLFVSGGEKKSNSNEIYKMISNLYLQIYCLDHLECVSDL